MGRRSPFTKTQKRDAVLSVLAGRQTVSEVCRELGISAQTFARWREQALAGMEAALRTRTTATGVRPSWSVSSLRRSARLVGWRWRTICWEKHRGG